MAVIGVDSGGGVVAVVVVVAGIAILYDILIAECSQCESAKSCQQQFSIGGLNIYSVTNGKKVKKNKQQQLRNTI